MPVASTDTVFALATPLGGPRAVVRITGPRAFAAVEGLVPSLPRARAAYSVKLPFAAGRVPAECWAFPAPASATGEDLIEIHLPGSPALIREVESKLTTLGCRPAPPGEFTRRALLNGKLDLAQAEAVMLLVTANDAQAARRARAALTGSLSRGVETLSKRLENLCARFEVSFDFDEDAASMVDTAEFAATARALAAELSTLRTGSAPSPAHIPTVVIAGPANAGKSTLFNALVGRERAAVSETAGTTRDVVWESATFGGIRVRLGDTAGFKEATDAIEAQSLSQTDAQAGAADLVLLVAGADCPEAPESVAFARVLTSKGIPVIQVTSKVDLGTVPLPESCLWVSAHSGRGLAELRAVIAAALQTRLWPERAAVSARAAGLLDEAAAALTDATDGLESHAPIEAVSDLARSALSRLREFLGREASAGVLDHIFANFCIGK